MTKKTKTGDDGVTPGGPGVNTVIKRNRDGTIRSVYYYHRATGQRLNGTPETPEYIKSLKAAERAGRAPAAVKEAKDRKRTGIWTEMVDTYQRSIQYQRLSKNTKRDYDGAFYELIKRLDWMTRKDVEDRTARAYILEMRDDVAKTGHLTMADRYVIRARLLLGFAYDRAMIGYNHAVGIEPLAAARPRAQITFKPDVRAKIAEAASSDLVAAYELALYTAARVGDLCSLEWAMIDDDGWLIFKPAKTARKTGVEVHLPTFALAPLAKLLERIPRDGKRILMRHGPRGDRPWTSTNLSRQWQLFKKSDLGAPDLHWHDLRGTAVSEMLRAGCTDAEVASITGHALGAGSSLGSYAERSRALALAAYTKWNNALAPKGKVISLRRK